MKKTWTGERLETFVFNENMIEHLHRYSLAMKYIKGKTVLDIACGEGYGSKLMSVEANYVFGVDISFEAIEAARKKYIVDSLEFRQGAADKIPLDDHFVDVIVSFETLEHHDKHTEMLLEFKRVLKPAGILIMSSPDKKYYTDDTGHVNRFHVKELHSHEFRQLVNDQFKNCVFLNQRFLGGSIIMADHDAKPMEIHSGNYNELNKPFDFSPMYNLVIASDHQFEPPSDSIFTAEEWYAMIVNDTVIRLKSSATWKAGRVIIRPLSFFKKIFKKVGFDNYP